MITAIKQNNIDVSSLSNFNQIMQKTFHLVDLNVDLSNKTMMSTTITEYEIIDKKTKSIILDCKGQEIISVFLVNDINNDINSSDNLQDLKFIVHLDHPFSKSLGTPLEIILPFNYDSSTINVKINFKVSTGSEGLQWLEKEQTTSKKYPFMFSQCEAILARTVIPCQDSPSAKVTFNKVLMQVEDGITAIFGGKLLNKSTVTKENKTYNIFEFNQLIKIPTYLFAVAAGEIEYKKMSERCGVYAEPHLIEKSAKEFVDCENFIKAAEEYLDYPYVWGEYNILVLPPAFPYGGMENPNMTFMNPSLVVGDKSMVPTAAHEIAHSWTGNLVTNIDWNNFWMNEGFTVFMERKIVEKVYGKDFALLEADVGLWAFKYAVDQVGCEHRYAALFPDLKSEDPDDCFSKVPYEKGCNFLMFLESILGEVFFRDIMRKHIKNNAYKAISHHDFVDLVKNEINNNSEYNENQKKEILDKIDFDTWILKPGYLPIEPNFSNSLSKAASDLFEELKSMNSFENVDLLNKHKTQYLNLASKAKVVFLSIILNNLKEFPSLKYEYLVKITNLNVLDKNPEIAYTWLQVALKNGDKRSFGAAMEFLKSNGRMKYIKPVFKEFFKAAKSLCTEFFNENKYLYHPVAVRILEDFFSKN